MEKGHLVYLEGHIDDLSVKPSQVAEVIEFLEDTVLVQPLDPVTMEPWGEELEVGEEECREIIDSQKRPATKETWKRE